MKSLNIFFACLMAGGLVISGNGQMMASQPKGRPESAGMTGSSPSVSHRNRNLVMQRKWTGKFPTYELLDAEDGTDFSVTDIGMPVEETEKERALFDFSKSFHWAVSQAGAPCSGAPALANCTECLEAECCWVLGVRGSVRSCVSNCDFFYDGHYWGPSSLKYYNNSLDALCEIASTIAVDTTICTSSGNSNCEICTSTLKSDGESTCSWYGWPYEYCHMGSGFDEAEPEEYCNENRDRKMCSDISDCENCTSTLKSDGESCAWYYSPLYPFGYCTACFGERCPGESCSEAQDKVIRDQETCSGISDCETCTSALKSDGKSKCFWYHQIDTCGVDHRCNFDDYPRYCPARTCDSTWAVAANNTETEFLAFDDYNSTFFGTDDNDTTPAVDFTGTQAAKSEEPTTGTTNDTGDSGLEEREAGIATTSQAATTLSIVHFFGLSFGLFGSTTTAWHLYIFL